MLLFALIPRYKRSTHEKNKGDPSLKTNNREKKEKKRDLRAATEDQGEKEADRKINRNLITNLYYIVFFALRECI